jgi:SAM-dependent methyltransferase
MSDARTDADLAVDAEALEAAGAELFWQLHGGLSKQAPGSDAATLGALAMLEPIPESPAILDLGCGPGRHTLALLRATRGRVVAVDLLQAFLDQLQASALREGLADRLETRCVSMAALAPPEFPDGAFDLLWCEGAIYNVGFDAGLRDWRRLLRPGGAIVVSELTWLTDAASAGLRRFWARDYPGMRELAANREAFARNGYRLVGEVVIPERDWWDDYYTPIAERLEAIRDRRDDPAWRAAVAAYDAEIAVVREGLGDFGYVLFAALRSDAR